jgi:hypothetical protein
MQTAIKIFKPNLILGGLLKGLADFRSLFHLINWPITWIESYHKKFVSQLSGDYQAASVQVRYSV